MRVVHGSPRHPNWVYDDPQTSGGGPLGPIGRTTAKWTTTLVAMPLNGGGSKGGEVQGNLREP